MDALDNHDDIQAQTQSKDTSADKLKLESSNGDREVIIDVDEDQMIINAIQDEISIDASSMPDVELATQQQKQAKVQLQALVPPLESKESSQHIEITDLQECMSVESVDEIEVPTELLGDSSMIPREEESKQPRWSEQQPDRTKVGNFTDQ